MRRLATIAAALMLFGSPGLAAESPPPGPVDPRIRTLAYDPEQVFVLTGYLGYQLMLEFAADERIENVSIGDALAWQVTPNKKATVLFLKPLERTAGTNMTVVTDRRSYVFDLAVAAPKAGPANLAYVVRFAYPPEPEPVVVVAEPVDPIPPLQARSPAYAFTGAPTIRPTEVFDDGHATYFAFAPETPLPAILVVGPDGVESLANFTVKRGYLVIDQTAARFVLRSGAASATVSDPRVVADPRAPAKASASAATTSRPSLWRRMTRREESR